MKAPTRRDFSNSTMALAALAAAGAAHGQQPAKPPQDQGKDKAMDTELESAPPNADTYAPVRSEDDFECRVTGRIPEELTGAYYRNGPNQRFDPTPAYHMIFADGMIHGFFLRDGKAHYRNRYVRTPRWLAEDAAGRALFNFMGRPSDPSVQGINTGAGNTNIVFHAGKLMALQEQSEPFQVDPATLDPKGFMETGGKFTAHPKIDPETGELVWFGYSAGSDPMNPWVDYGVTDATGRVTRRDRFMAPFCSMMHDFLVTKNYVLFPVLPLTGNYDRVKSGRPGYAWEPEKGGYVGVLKRSAPVDTIRWIEVDPCYVFHMANAWEDGSKIHGEMAEYKEANFPRPDGSPTDGGGAYLMRWTIDLAEASPRVRKTLLDDISGEFPRVDDRYAGLPYRHIWYSANKDPRKTMDSGALAHFDVRTNKRNVRNLAPGETIGEPLFVARHASAAEGDGWVLALVHSQATDRSSLMILNALDIEGEPQAVLELPRRVPAGFHGNWAQGV